MPDPGHSGIYVYGVLRTPPGPALPEDLSGMDGDALEVVEAESLGAVVTAVVLPRPPGRRRDLLSHTDVLNTLATRLDVVPLRFGAVFPDRAAVVDELLIPRGQQLEGLLDRLADGVQLNLRASYVEERVLADVVSGNPEIRRLRERTKDLPEGTPHPDAVRLGQLVSAVLDDLRREDTALLAESVLPLVRDSRVRERFSTDHVLDLALLVDRESVGVVEDELEAVAADVHERIRLELTGPLAPFDFLDEAAAWAS
jgi:hypothetical protein